MRIANVNVFIAALILAEALLSSLAVLLVTVVAVPLRLILPIREDWIYVASQLLILIALILISVRYDLSPMARKPERERRYRIGHWLLAVTHCVAAAAIVTPFALAAIYNKGEFTLFLWYAIPVVGVAMLVWAAGLFMIWSSRA
jgi:hypothetical protein